MRRKMLGRVATGAAAVLALAGGAPHANLVETAVVASPRSVARGAPVRVGDTVRNVGGAQAGRSVTAYYLSRSGERVRLGRRRVPALAPRETSRRTKTVRVPSTATLGLYRLLACADVGRRVLESDETGNCRAARGRIRVIRPSGDRAPPTFAGLVRATTCIPGPVGEGRSSSYRLVWNVASDNVTPAGEIAYDVYQATETGGERFAAPTYATAPGAEAFTTPQLPSSKSYYFVVRARDRAGNRDANRVERLGENLCL